MSLARYGFVVKIKEEEPKPLPPIYAFFSEELNQCTMALSILKDYWFSRSNSKSLEFVEQIDILIYGTRYGLTYGHNILQQIDKLNSINFKILQNPRGANEEVTNSCKQAKENLEHAVKAIVSKYKNLNK